MSRSNFERLSGFRYCGALLVPMVFVLNACVGIAIPGKQHARQSIYIGTSGIASQLEPDTSESRVFSLGESQSAGAGLIVGMDLADRWSAETRFSVLGSADLEPSASVNYQSADASLLFYALGDIESLNSRRGFAGFLRGGVNMMMHDSEITLDSEDNFQVLAGLGADYLFANGFGLRAEIDFHDTDALAGHLGLLYRFGSRNPPVPRVVETARQPAPQPRPQITQRPAPQPVPQPVPQQVPAPAPQPAPQVAVAPQPAALPETSNQPVEIVASPSRLTSGVLRGVRFIPGSVQLDAAANRVLAQLAQELINRPSAIVELAAHTSGSAGSRAAMDLTRKQVSVVGRLLISQGVSSRQLQARAFGANQPRAGATTNSDNERIELLVVQP